MTKICPLRMMTYELLGLDLDRRHIPLLCLAEDKRSESNRKRYVGCIRGSCAWWVEGKGCAIPTLARQLVVQNALSE